MSRSSAGYRFPTIRLRSRTATCELDVHPLPAMKSAEANAAGTVAWFQASPKLRAWVEAIRPRARLDFSRAPINRTVLRPARRIPMLLNYDMIGGGGPHVVAALGGEQTSESGDMSCAWNCFAAVMRISTHLRRRGGLIEHVIARSMDTAVRQRLAVWAADTRTSSRSTSPRAR